VIQHGQAEQRKQQPPLPWTAEIADVRVSPPQVNAFRVLALPDVISHPLRWTLAQHESMEIQ